MITASSTSPHIVAYANGASSSAPYGSGIGAVRYNQSSRALEVEVSGCWYQLTNPNEHVIVGMSPDSEAAIEWAAKKSKIEEKAKELAEQYPAVKLAIDQVNEAYANLEMVTTLCA